MRCHPAIGDFPARQRLRQLNLLLIKARRVPWAMAVKSQIKSHQ
jgi:hypothetical protein